MVPTTPGSELAKGIGTIILQAGGPVGTQTKVLEHPGTNVNLGISPNNPFPRTKCHREDCPYAEADQPCRERCMNVGSIYKATCTKCEHIQERDQIQEEDREHHVYIGETARTVYIRRKEHIRDYIRAARERVIP